MKFKNQRLIILSAITVVSVLTIFAALYSRIEQPKQITPLELRIASLPLGVSQADAENYMGSEPYSISKTSGVLMNSVTMLSSDNDLADKYGKPQDFTMCHWKRDGVSAVVAIDTNGKVAGRWSWRQ